jgi:predicted ester cyclase
MSAEENKAVIRRFIEEFLNDANIAIADEIFDNSCTVHHPATPEPIRGVAGMKGHMTMVFSALPDFHVVVDDMMTEGEKVAVRMTISGTLKGGFAGNPPTDKHATWSGIAIYRIVGGKIMEGWEELDLLGAWQRLGVLPAPG